MKTITGTSRWMLTDEEAKRRIAAARVLRGLSQDELDKLGANDGLGQQELSRTERGELPVTKVRREALARLLNVPGEWFSADSIDTLIRRPSDGASLSDLERLEERLSMLDDLQRAVEGVSQQLEEVGVQKRISDLFAADRAREEDSGEHGDDAAQR